MHNGSTESSLDNQTQANARAKMTAGNAEYNSIIASRGAEFDNGWSPIVAIVRLV